MTKGISIIIPVFNESESIEELFNQIIKVLKTEFKDYSYEILLINDGSTDNSFNILKKLSLKNKNISIISFRKNLGKATALNEGFKKAKKQIVVTMDADLQDGPENLFQLVAKLNEGYDLVVGWKKNRHDPWHKKLASRSFNLFVGKFSKIPLHDFNSGLKVMRNQVAKELYLYGELHRFIPVLANQRGFIVTEIPVVHHQRKYGSSKYGLERLLKGFFDFLTVVFLGKYRHKPLHLFGILGLVSIFIGLVLGLYLTVLHFQGTKISGRPILNLSILLIMAGLQLFSTGLIAEMIVNRSNTEDILPIDYETE